MKVIPLSEGSFRVGADKTFQPQSASQALAAPSADGAILVEVQPFCVITQRDILVLDTGLGFQHQGQPQIIYNLAQHGIQSTDVTKVLISHLHKDHAGGISSADRLGNQQLNFPNAAYFVQRREYDYAEETGYPSFIVDEFSVFDHNQKVFWLNDDAGTIDGYIRYELTGAHSKFHQVFWIQEGGETVFFGGDDAPQHKQMHSRFIAKYDYDGRKAMELRQQWWEEGSREGWTFLFYHDTTDAVLKAGV